MYLNIDEVYDIIGHLGFAQFIYFISLSVIQIYTAQHMLLNIFTGIEPAFICETTDKKENIIDYTNECFENSVSNCKLKFNESFSTIVTEWNLVCNEKYKVALVQSLWMGGVMAGALFLSSLADHFGRLKTLMLSIICTIIFESFASFSSSYMIFVILRFIGGMACSLVILVSFVLSQELIGSNRRSICAIILTMFFPFGIALLSLIAAKTSSWRSLTLLCSLFGIVYIFIPFFLPESPRWLAGQGQLKASKRVLELIAKGNGTAHLLPSHWDVCVGGQEKRNQKHHGICGLTSHPYVLRLTLIQIYSWFVNSTVYYALTMAASSSNHQGSIYLATTLNGFVELPAYIVTILIIERLGRKSTLCLFMITGGVFCMLIPIIPSSYMFGLVLIGKLAISASFSTIYLHSGEIFPTVIRNSAMGIVSVAARFGGMVSPFVLMLGDIQPNLHFVVLGLATFFAGILNMGLPETLGRPLPETIADVISLRDPVIPFTKVNGGTSKQKPYEKLRQESDDEE